MVRRVTEFTSDFRKVVQHSTRATIVHALDSDGRPVMVGDEPAVVTDIIFDPPELLHRFEEKWQLRVHRPLLLIDIMSTQSTYDDSFCTRY